jgi:hypothetical protein
LEGLEVSIIPFKSVNLADRADAEYFSKENRAIETSLKEHDAHPLREFGTLVGSAFYPAATDLYDEGDVPFARCVDCITHPIISREQDSEFVRLPSWFIEKSKQIDVAGQGDIIITKVGTPCYASIVQDYERIALSRTVMGLVDIHGINPYYLTAFLRSKFGFNQLLRQREQTIQFQLTLERVRDVLIYKASPQLQLEVEKVMLAYMSSLRESGEGLAKAEAIMTAAVGLSEWNPPEPLAYVVRSSQVFAARRLDAAYFAPRVTSLLDHLGSADQSIGDAAPARRERFSPAGIGVFRYMEIGDLHNDGTATTSNVSMRAAPSRATWYARSGDVVTSTVRPNRRLSAIIAPDQDGCVVSSGLVVLQPKTVPAEVLLTYLRLPVFCQLMDLHTSASLYPAISDRDLVALPFPIFDSATCDKIGKTVHKAHTARDKANRLLARAKHVVEIAIECSEQNAFEYLKETY